MRVIGAPLLDDNYGWLLCPEDGGPCAVVDPSEAEPIESILEEEDLSLAWILATHHHHDHVGGIRGLLARLGSIEVICSRADGERIEGTTLLVSDGERVGVAATVAEALLVPGHTRGAVAWHFPAERLLFTGDTLFSGGCGRLFEGSAAEMHASLMRLRSLPEETRVHCGHEYTVKNLRFALEIEPGNEHVRERLAAEEARRSSGEPTVPSTLRIEKLTNPFLRVDEPTIMRIAGRSDPVSTFAELRRRRDVF